MKLFDAIESGDLPALRNLMREGVDLFRVDEETGIAPLALAADGGHANIARVLLRAGVDPDWGGVTTPLEAAAAGGHIEVAETLLAASADVNRPVADGFTPLITAASTGDVAMVQLLLENGANVHVTDDEGDTALNVARKNGYKEVAEILERQASNGNNGQRRPGKGDRPDNIFFAIEDRDLSRLTAVLANGAQDALDDRDRRGRTPLARASSLGHLALIRALLKSGAEVNGGGSKSPLFHAVTHGHEPVARELLAAGAEADATAGDGRTALMEAAAAGHVDIVRLLLENGADPKRRDQEERDALWYAAAAGRQQTFDLLAPHFDEDERKESQAEIQSFVEWREQTAQSASKLTDLLHAGEIAPAKRYLASGLTDPDGFDDKGRTAMMIAARLGLADVVRMLISAGASFEAEDDEDGWTALIHAIYGEGPEPHQTISILASAGANLDHASRDGQTPLMHAVNAYLAGEDEEAEAFAHLAEPLLHLGADTDARDGEGRNVWARVREAMVDESTPAEIRRRLNRVRRILEKAGVKTDGSLSAQLLAATSEGQSGLLADLLERGSREKVLEMPLLSVAADNNHWEVVNFLVGWGFDINAANSHGETILMQAAMAGHQLIVEQLIAAGADTAAKNEDKKTAAALAETAGYEEIGKLIRKAARSGKKAAAAPVEVAEAIEEVEEVEEMEDAEDA